MNRSSIAPTAQPTVIKQQYDALNVWDFENEWQTKFCSCNPAGRCCFSCFCSCCMGCKLAKRIGEPAIIGCLPCSFPYLRTKLRTARRIEGYCCSDFCASCVCCNAFSATQMANELEAQGLWDVPKPPKRNNKHHRNDRNDRFDRNDRSDRNDRTDRTDRNDRFNQHNDYN